MEGVKELGRKGRGIEGGAEDGGWSGGRGGIGLEWKKGLPGVEEREWSGGKGRVEGGGRGRVKGRVRVEEAVQGIISLLHIITCLHVRIS